VQACGDATPDRLGRGVEERVDQAVIGLRLGAVTDVGGGVDVVLRRADRRWRVHDGRSRRYLSRRYLSRRDLSRLSRHDLSRHDRSCADGPHGGLCLR
jgi:hypothetical protein